MSTADLATSGMLLTMAYPVIEDQAVRRQSEIGDVPPPM